VPGFRVVDIGQNAGVVHVEELRFSGVAAHHVARRAGFGERQKLGDELARKPDGMAAMSDVARHAHQRGRRPGQQSIDGGGRDGGVVHQGKEHAIGLGRYGAQPALHGGGLPARPVRVHHESGGGVCGGANPLRLGAQHHNHRRAARGEQAGQPVEKRLLAVSQQSFRKTHAARFAGG